MAFSGQLRAARARKGIAQAIAAAAIDELPLRTLQEWEQGRHEPPAWAQKLVLATLDRIPAK